MLKVLAPNFVIISYSFFLSLFTKNTILFKLFLFLISFFFFLDVNDKNPLYTLQKLLVKKWYMYPLNIREQYLKIYRDELKKNIDKFDESIYPKKVLDTIKMELSKL